MASQPQRVTGRLHADRAIGILSDPGSDRLLSIGSGATDTHPGTAATVYGIVTNPILPATATESVALMYLAFRLANTAFTLADASAVYIESPSLPHAASLATILRGLRIRNQGSAKVASAVGIEVDAQSGSAANYGIISLGGTQGNVWLRSDVAGAGGGLLFGASGDASLFRAAVAMLQTATLALTGRLRIAEQAAPPTPPSGHGEFYVSTSGVPRFINDAGVDSDLAAGGGGGYATIQEEGSPVTARTTLNFVGANVTAADNAGSGRTDVTVTSKNYATRSYAHATFR